MLLTRDTYQRLRMFYGNQIRMSDKGLCKALVMSPEGTITTTVEHINGRVKYE
jgi:hypothetical protein